MIELTKRKLTLGLLERLRKQGVPTNPTGMGWEISIDETGKESPEPKKRPIVPAEGSEQPGPMERGKAKKKQDSEEPPEDDENEY